MAHTVNKPADSQTIAQGPADIRAEIAKVANDQVTDAGTLKGLSPGNNAGQIPVSNGVVNAGLNAEKLGGNLPSAFSPANHVHGVATSSSNGFIDNASWNKLQGIADGAEVNQNAFSNVLVSGTTIQADSKTDTLELAAGTNISVVADSTNDRVTFNVTGKVASAVSADTSATCTGNAASASTLSNFFVGDRSSADVNTYLTSGMFALHKAPANAPTAYLAGIVAKNIDVGLQIAGGYATDNLWFRGWHSYGATFTAWRSVVHSGNIGSQSVNYATSAGSAPASGGMADEIYDNAHGTPHRVRSVNKDTTVSGDSAAELMLWNGSGYYRIRTGLADYADSAGSVPWSGVTGAPGPVGATDYVIAQSLSGENGYRKWASGWIEQWGYVLNSSAAYDTITFPIAFPNQCRRVIKAWENWTGVNGLWGTHSPKTLNTKTGFTADDYTKSNRKPYYWNAEGN